MKHGLARQRDEGEPRWVVEEESRRHPGALFEQTYEAIASGDATGSARRRRRHRPRATGWLVALAALAGGGFAARTTLAPSHPARVAPPAPVASPPARAEPHGPPLIGAVPVRPKATVRIGETVDFAVVAGGGDLRYGWTLDASPAGTGPRWTYSPTPGSAGRHRVDVSVADRSGSSTQHWDVRVRPGRDPRIVVAQPPRDVIDATAGDTVKLSVGTTPATSDETLATRWTVDGAPAGDGSALSWRAPHPGAFTVRAVVQSTFGGMATREWSVHAVAPEPPPVVAAVPAVVPAAEEPPRAAPPVPDDTPRAAPAPRPRSSARTAAPPRASADDDVRRWLDRYAAAWRAHDVDALRRMGQVSTDDQVSALQRYFDRVRDLDVEVDVVAMDVRREGAVVRFVRRDRFRDPAGRLVETESPPIEKHLVRTSDGFRLVPAPPA